MEGSVDRTLADTERWFLARGTPHLIEAYSATTDVFTRSLPVLTVIFLGSVAGAANVGWPWWQNLLAVAGGCIVLLGVWAVTNRLRGRPALQRPDSIGSAELTAFVLGPALLQLLSGQGRAALVTAVSLAGLLLLVYVVTSYGLIPLSRWALAKTARELRAVVALLARALPLLLLIQIVLFINTEMWQVAAGFTGAFLALVIGLFFVVGVSFLMTRLPAEIGLLSRFDDPAELHRLTDGTPVAHDARDVTEAIGLQPLTRRQRGNVLLVALFSQGLQVLVVTFVLGGFFVLLGVLTITPEVVTSWLGRGADVLVDREMWGHRVQISAELLKLAAFLAAFSGLYFSVTLVTDDTYRREFFDEVLAELRQTFAVRAVYLRLRGATATRAGAPPDPTP